MSPAPVDKYRSRREELESLQEELTVQQRPGDPAPVIGRVLEAAGDLLRRTAAAPAPGALVQATLALVSEAGLSSWGQSVDVAQVRTKLLRAASQAVEAALPDAEDDAAALVQWALQDLQARDRLESALTALEALGQLRGDAKALWGRLRRQADGCDEAPRRAVHALTALNHHRRAEAQLLDGAHRARAWWFSLRSAVEDDLLVKTLGGEGHGALRPEERRADELVRQKRPRRHTFEELLGVDLGLAGAGAAAALKLEAGRAPEVARVLAAMEEGERAIEEATSGARASEAKGDGGSPHPQASEAAEVVEARAEFKVLVLRPKGRVQVVVQPRRVDRFAAAAVSLPHEGHRQVQEAPHELGLLFDLGKAAAHAGRSARVVVRLTDGRTVSTEVAL